MGLYKPFRGVLVHVAAPLDVPEDAVFVLLGCRALLTILLGVEITVLVLHVVHRQNATTKSVNPLIAFTSLN